MKQEDSTGSVLTRRDFLIKAVPCLTTLGITVAALETGCGGGSNSGSGIVLNKSLTQSELAAMEEVATTFMSDHDVPGMSVAIARNDVLVYANGFGMADVGTGEEVTPAHLFRIASMSKPLTATTIMRLVAAGRMLTTDNVFGPGHLLGTKYPYTAPYIQDITVEHLLTHTVGAWPNTPPTSDPTLPDPAFLNPTMSQDELIAWTLQNPRWTLTTQPGQNFAYSNFGYLILGRVIEKVAKSSYANAVYQYVLQPCGITDMFIGGDTLAQRRQNEVIYYGQGSDDPYTVLVTRADSAGGWVATATDMVRFLMHVDLVPAVTDILTASVINQMTTPTSASLTALKNSGYGEGWFTSLPGATEFWWHGGDLRGTRTVMARADDGFCWAVLTNTRPPAPQFETSWPDSATNKMARNMIDQVNWSS